MSKEKIYCVYIHISPSNKAYIGITSQKPEQRWKDGNGYLRKSKYGEYIQPAMANAIKKYGWDNFKHVIWADNLSKEEACKYEATLIDLFNTNNSKYGYNIRPGGDVGAVGLVMSDVSRKRLSESKKGIATRTGAILNSDTKAKISNARKKNWQDEKYRQNQIEKHKWQTGENHPMYGKHHSEASKEKIRNAHIGKSLTDITKRKISEAASGTNNPFYGKQHSDESRQKISASLSGINNPGIRQVVQYDQQGNLIQVWDYIRQASQVLGINECGIGACCRGQQKTAGGFIWKYASEVNIKDEKNFSI